MNQELLEASGQHVLGLLVATITNVGHQHLALEPPADPVVNTSGLAPVFLNEKWATVNYKFKTNSQQTFTNKVQTVVVLRHLPQSSHICQTGGE